MLGTPVEIDADGVRAAPGATTTTANPLSALLGGVLTPALGSLNDTLQAAVLSAKLPHLAGWSEKRRENARYYSAALNGIEGVCIPVIDPKNESIFNQYTIRARRRDDLQAYLKKRQIGTAIYYPLPLHLQPCFAYLGYREGSCPESERASKEVLSLPIYPELGRSQLDEVVDAVRSFYEQ